MSEAKFPEALQIDLETGAMRSMTKAELDAEMNAPSDVPRVFKVVVTDDIKTRDGLS